MIKARLYDVIVAPVISEKSTMANGLSKYTFKISESATKQDVTEAVEQIFGVRPSAVNVLNVKPKARVFKGRKGVKPGYRKAIVTIESGKTIDLGIGA